MSEPKNLNTSKGEGTVFGLTIGARDSWLLLGTPRDKVIAKIDGVFEGGAMSVRITSTVRIRLTKQPREG